MNIGDESSLYPLTAVKLAINRAYRKAGGLFRWPETEDAKKTSTQINEYYDYPDNWRPDSVYRLEVDDEQYGETPDGSPMRFDDYLTWRRDSLNANSTEKKWANQWRRYFIYPVPAAVGTNNISIWGQKTVDALSGDSDITIFSFAYPECNDAIILEAKKILKARVENQKASEELGAESKLILSVAWGKIRQEQAKYEKTQPFFDVPDLFGKSAKDKYRVGNFYP